MRLNILLLQVAIAFAAPPAQAQPAQAKPANAIRAEDAAAATSSYSLTVANSFTSLASSSVNPGGVIQSATTSAAVVVETGEFTAADGGVYGVTISNGYAVVDGKTLALGQGALIGNEIVSEGSSGFVANGQTLVLSTVSVTSTASTTTAAAAGSGSGGSSTMASSTRSGTSSESSGSAAAASSGSSSSSEAAAPAVATGYGGLAAAGGLIALFAL
ncbi:hypothetical protein EJ03DRAFT_97802 [Teratosphaeria nubilosa]|uniref:Uncharacterized protein n=1 Tax=Teratosphaeria nubilosa TaxID=161662 RepID=A0A6G1L8R8_9PEZI|nr:hypothetical protein EJ03DRAFT_97802 [Teratosphaeria nubilosa]